MHFRALAVLPLAPAVLPLRYLLKKHVIQKVGKAFGGTGAVLVAVLPPKEKLWTACYEKFNIFCIRTPNSMILGSFRREQQALQDHVEKHHSPRKDAIKK